MKIGDFAKACNTKISVLRHYDSMGILKPIYIDRFTEYRYYDESQIKVFERICELRAVGFSLSEIGEMLYSDKPADVLFDRKKAELERQLRDLEKMRENTEGISAEKINFKPVTEDVDIPFENDERVIGKWMITGEVESGGNPLGNKDRILYFLPGGEKYWCFGWSRGKLIYDDGESRFVNDYCIEEHSDELYMIVSFKTQNYPENGETAATALRKLDSVRYTKEMIARRDDIDKPFVSDERVPGKWKAFCYIDSSEVSKDDFIPYVVPPKGSRCYEADYFKEITFEEGGHVTAVLGDEIISGDDAHTWTRGYWLRKYNSCACAYEIREYCGKEYLIIEWKSGDYRFGGWDTDYYVMVRG